MDKIVVAHMGVEGGGATVYGHQLDGAWAFWQEGSSMHLDDDYEETWPSWASDPVPELLRALPDQWWLMYPIEIHPDFVAQLRDEYQRRCGAQAGSREVSRHQHERWQELLAVSG